MEPTILRPPHVVFIVAPYVEHAPRTKGLQQIAASDCVPQNRFRPTAREWIYPFS